MKKSSVFASTGAGLIVMAAAAAGLIFGSGPLYENLKAPSPSDMVVGEGLMPGNFPEGTYTGTAHGFGGEIQAVVELSKDRIESITVTGDGETPGIGSVAVETLPEEMLARQTPVVDSISSATVSSDAVKLAVVTALATAGIDGNALVPVEAAQQAATDETVTADVVVIGAGGAGMTAAIQLKQEGLNVVILDKMPMVGGNTLKATGGMNAAETSVQAKLGIEDSIETFVEDTIKGGHDINDEALVRVMAENSAAAIDWLETIGAPLPEVSFSGGATNKRIHRPKDGAGVGAYLVTAFDKKVKELEIPVYLKTTATEITAEDGTVTGVKAHSDSVNYTFEAKAVILATGGFGANEEMYTKYRPDLKGFVTTNTPCATGDGIVMAEALGADLTDIEQIQTHPTVEQTTSIMITESVRGGGAILVNQTGERFINELLTRDVVSEGIRSQEGGYAYLIFDQQQRENLKAIEKYVENGIVEEADTVEELAEKIGVPAETLKTTVETWVEAVHSKNDAAFGRTTGMDVNLEKSPYYAIKIAPGVHHTMGGVKIDTKAEVISTSGSPIPGLFAAGEVTGGIHGGNRIGGNAVADIVVFGRVAADSAAEYCKASQ